MKSPAPRADSAAFTLVEIVLSFAIIATAFLGIFAMLPAGLSAAQRATQSTIVATILDSVHHRLQGELLTPRAGEGVSFSPALFDVQGTYIAPDAPSEQLDRAVYRVEVTLADWEERPVNTSALRVATITVAAPVNGRSKTVPTAARALTVVSFPVTALTGTDWPAVAREYKADPLFEPKIGF